MCVCRVFFSLKKIPFTFQRAIALSFDVRCSLRATARLSDHARGCSSATEGRKAGVSLLCSLRRVFVSSCAHIARCHQPLDSIPRARRHKKAERKEKERKKEKEAHACGTRRCAAVLITPDGSIRRSVLMKSRGIPAASAAPERHLAGSCLRQPRPHGLAAWGGDAWGVGGFRGRGHPRWPCTRSPG